MQGGEQLGLALTPSQAGQMVRHAQLLIEWNRRINLTAITDPEQVLSKHCLDAIVASSFLTRNGTLLDIGTGGGFPGIPLKIMRPDVTMTLIDSVRKKISFVNHVIRELDLEKIEALHTRAQDLAGRREYQASFDTVTCRALTDLESVLRLALPMLTPKGKIVAYQGPNDPSLDEVADRTIKSLFSCVDQLFYRLPLLGDERRLLVLQKN